MTWSLLAAIIVYPSFGFILWNGGNAFCRVLLKICRTSPLPTMPLEGDAAAESPAPPVPPAPQDAAAEADERIRAGRVIGGLERILIVIGIVFARWEIIAGVVALKTVARYQELDKKLNAEYFLVGSLASILWAILTALALFGYDHLAGYQVIARIKAMISAGDS